jgi:hypothetical protein
MSGNTDNPDYVEPTPSAPEAPAVEADASTEDMIDELRIPSPEVKDEQPADEAAPTARVTEADYATWSNEIAMTGDLSDETRLILRRRLVSLMLWLMIISLLSRLSVELRLLMPQRLLVVEKNSRRFCVGRRTISLEISLLTFSGDSLALPQS